MRILGTCLLVIAVGAACTGGASDSDDGAGWRGETTERAGATVVRTLSGSIWRNRARLIEEASIGVERGPDAYMLGRVTGIAATDGEVFVLDRQVPVIRVYDFAGLHLRDIGSGGNGPGEFRRPDSLVIGPDGRIYVRDIGTGRINILSTDGEALGTMPLETSFAGSTGMLMSTTGVLYNYERAASDPRSGERPIGMVPRHDDGSRGEPRLPPAIEHEPAVVEARREGMTSISNVPFAPRLVWTLAPSGALIAGVGDDYRFEVHVPDGSVRIIEKAWNPVAVDPDEAAWLRRTLTEEMREVQPDWEWNGPEIPGFKPAFDSLIADHSDRIWVTRSGPGVHEPGCELDPQVRCWSSPRIVEVFELEGRYLGAIDVPSAVQWYPLPYIRGELFLAVELDELGTIRVKRYRLTVQEP